MYQIEDWHLVKNRLTQEDSSSSFTIDVIILRLVYLDVYFETER